MRISDWSSDVCSSDLLLHLSQQETVAGIIVAELPVRRAPLVHLVEDALAACLVLFAGRPACAQLLVGEFGDIIIAPIAFGRPVQAGSERSEEHTSELQSLMRTSYAVLCVKKKTSENIPITQNDK